VKRVIFCIAAVLILTSISHAQEEVKATKEYMPLAKGNFWEYNVKEGSEEEKDGKLEITEKIGEGRFKVKRTNIMGEDSPASLEFCVEGEFFCWEVRAGQTLDKWQMLKFGATKGDSWTSIIVTYSASLTITSTIAAVEDVSTPAGVFKSCLKVVHTQPMESDTTSMWFAKGIGMVRMERRSSEGEVEFSWILTKYKIVQESDAERISGWLKESKTALLVEVISVTDVKPEKEGEAVSKVKVTAKVDKALKGKSLQTELSIEMAVGSIKVGKFVLFFKKGEKGDVIFGEPVPATEENLKVIEEILNPPKFADTISDAFFVIAGKVVTCEDRGTFKYYVVEIIKTFKGEKKEFIDVFKTEGLDLENGKIYLFALKPTVVSGRNYFEQASKNAVVLHSEELEKQIGDTLKAQKEK
jgi:hypothetical protein